MDSLDANPNYLLIACRLFNLVGITVIIANSVVLVVINTSRDLRSRMCLYSFMSVGELVKISAISSALKAHLLQHNSAIKIIFCNEF